MIQRCTLCGRVEEVPAEQAIVVFYRTMRLCRRCWESFLIWTEKMRIEGGAA